MKTAEQIAIALLAAKVAKSSLELVDVHSLSLAKLHITNLILELKQLNEYVEKIKE
jgi:hypothetical protein